MAGRGLALVFADGRLAEIFDPTLNTFGNGAVARRADQRPVVPWRSPRRRSSVHRAAFGRRLVAIGGNRAAAVLPACRSAVRCSPST